MLIFLWVTLCLCHVAALGDDKVMRAPEESLKEFCRKLLPPQTELAHPPLALAFGPSDRNIVMLFRTTYDENTNYVGWILVPDKATAGSYIKFVLPPMSEIPGHFDITVDAVFAARVGSNFPRDLVVLYEYHRNGSTRDDGYASYVYSWTGKNFQVQKEATDKLTGTKTAAEARRKLRMMH